MNNYTIKVLKEEDKPKIHKLLYFAFEEFNQNEYEAYDYFCMKLRRAGVDISYSFGAFTETDELVGVVLNAIDKVYAFDFITAVHPKHRGNNIASKLIEFSLNALREKNISTYRSEIFTSNHNAFHLFVKLGMKKTRELSTYKGNISYLSERNSRAKKEKLSSFKGNIPNDIDHLPSWENVTRIINRNKEQFDLYYIELPITKRIVGYAIIQRDKGIVRQFNVEEMLFRNYFAYQIFTRISKEHSQVKVIDVDVDWDWLTNTYEKFGLVETNRVHEMEVVLNSRDQIA